MNSMEASQKNTNKYAAAVRALWAPIRAKISMESILSVSFFAVAALLAFGAVVTCFDTVGLGKTHGWLQQHMTRAVTAELIRADLANARVEQAKFALTGDLDYLMSAERFLHEALNSAGTPKGDRKLEPEIQAQLRSIRQDVDKIIMGRHQKVVAAYKESGIPAARAFLRKDLLENSDDPIHTSIMSFRHDQGLMIRDRGTLFEQQIQRTVSGSVFVVVLLGIVILLVISQSFVKARRKAEERVFMSQQHIKAVADNMLDGLIAIDGDGKIISTNSTASGLFSKRGASLIGANVADLFVERDGNSSFLLSTLLTRSSGKLVECKAKVLDGDPFVAEVAVSKMAEMGVVSALVTVRDITERVYAEQWKKDFVSTISNDLFSPLSEVQHSLRKIREQKEPVPAKMGEVLLIGERNATRLLHLINDLSDLESLESGNLQVVAADCCISEAIERSMESVRSLAEDKKVTVVTQVRVQRAFADPNRVVQVLVNLLSNAIKFSVRESSIEIIVEEVDNMVRFSVRDFGRGIAKGAQQAIFERYKQADSSDAKTGTGLGLPICKLIVERQGGAIGVESEPGQGSTFWFSLPVSS